MNSLEFLYELSWAKSNPLKLDSFASLALTIKNIPFIHFATKIF
jgi:hypothetical protein